MKEDGRWKMEEGRSTSSIENRTSNINKKAPPEMARLFYDGVGSLAKSK